MPTLDGALAFAQMHDRSVGVTKYLELDVSRALQILLHVDRTVSESRLGFTSGRLEGPVQLVRPLHHPHPLPAPSHRCLEKDRESKLPAGLGRVLLVGDGSHPAGNDGDAGLLHATPGLGLVSHGRDGLRGRPDEDHPGVLHGPGEALVFRQESVAGMDRVGTSRVGCLQDSIRAQVTLRRGWWADGVRRIGEEDMGGSAISFREDGDGPDSELPASSDYPNGDFPSIGDEDRLEHQLPPGLVNSREPPKVIGENRECEKPGGECKGREAILLVRGAPLSYLRRPWTSTSSPRRMTRRVRSSSSS